MANSIPVTGVIHRTGWFVLYLFAAFIVARITINATIIDDAYFTFRVVDNFLNGYGLRWNITERVQVFTNPLWTLLHIPLYWLFPWHIEYVNVGLSIACVIGSILLILRIFDRKSPWILIIFFLIPIFFSKTLAPSFTFGLENPLSIFLFSCFAHSLWKNEQPQWLQLSFYVSLAMLNRLDVIILYAPVMVYLIVTNIKSVRWRHLVIGSLPILIWLVFALWYYGSLIPNTKYAKLSENVSNSRYLLFGQKYALHLLFTDTITGFTILIAPILSLYFLILRKDKTWQEKSRSYISLGLVAYCLYVVYVGGQYVPYIFFSMPCWVGMWLILTYAKSNVSFSSVGYALAVTATILLATQLDYTKRWVNYLTSGHWLGIGHRVRVLPYGSDIFSKKHLIARSKSLPKISKYCLCRASIDVKIANTAIAAFTGGHCVHYINTYGITDPLLSRLPGYFWRIGHIRRSIPMGYFEAIQRDDTTKMDQFLAEYYEKLRVITSGDLFSLQRLSIIIQFNLGQYDHLLIEHRSEIRRKRRAPDS